MIKLILLTGFLGTGKTTLLSELLTTMQEDQIGIIVNEFGEIGIDGKLIERDGVRMKELSNGSIFCACIKDKFITSLIAMSAEPISHLFIEASGLADPANMTQILSAISKKTKDDYDYRGSICVIDAESFLDYYELLPALHQQLIYSNNIIVNKIDLVPRAKLEEVVSFVEDINKEAAIYITSYCKIPYYELIQSMEPRALEAKESSNTFESRPKSFILQGKKTIPHDALLRFLSNISRDAFRIKGFVETTNGSFYISGVRGRIEFIPWETEIISSEIVIISSIGIRMMSNITQGLKTELEHYLYL